MEQTGKLKVVVHLSGGQARVGVQEESTDPVLETLGAGTLEEALAAVPGVVTRARERWAQTPRNPKYEGPPLPPPQPAVQRRQEPAREGRMNQMF